MIYTLEYCALADCFFRYSSSGIGTSLNDEREQVKQDKTHTICCSLSDPVALFQPLRFQSTTPISPTSLLIRHAFR